MCVWGRKKGCRYIERSMRKYLPTTVEGSGTEDVDKPTEGDGSIDCG